MTTASSIDSSMLIEVEDNIRNAPRQLCYMCGAEGTLVYDNLADRLSDAPGLWSLKRCESRMCGLMWLDPMPIEADLWRAYQTYYTHSETMQSVNTQSAPKRLFRLATGRLGDEYLAHKYGYKNDRQPHYLGLLQYLFPWQQTERDLSVMFLPRHPTGQLLEIGCGGGDLLENFNRLGWNAEGTDVDPIAIRKCKSRGLNVKAGSLGDLQYPADNFDAVVMVHVIEHVHDPRALVRECYRILKPGGRLSLVTPNAKSFYHRSFGRFWLPLDPPRHLHIFTPAAMDRLLHESGFVTGRSFTTIRNADGLYGASRSIQRSGRFVMQSRQPRLTRMIGRLTQMLEWLLMTVDPTVGEELTVVVRKGYSS
jgi:2-polyprenyl-3-methyl-5-hydroxy-6-metoxy-1,4-benzoquinol methylase